MNKAMMQRDAVIIQAISPDFAHDLCKKITADLPEWFGQAEANGHYLKGMLTRTSFAASVDREHSGLITLEFPYMNNANIYWLGILKNFHNQGIGKQLILAAEKFAFSEGAKSLTVETLSPIENDINYNKTYNFYLKNGFSPLFDLKPYNPDQNMVYMYKTL